MKGIIYITRAVVKRKRVKEAETSKCTMHTWREEREHNLIIYLM